MFSKIIFFAFILSNSVKAVDINESLAPQNSGNKGNSERPPGMILKENELKTLRPPVDYYEEDMIDLPPKYRYDTGGSFDWTLNRPKPTNQPFKDYQPLQREAKSYKGSGNSNDGFWFYIIFAIIAVIGMLGFGAFIAFDLVKSGQKLDRNSQKNTTDKHKKPDNADSEGHNPKKTKSLID